MTDDTRVNSPQMNASKNQERMYHGSKRPSGPQLATLEMTKSWCIHLEPGFQFNWIRDDWSPIHQNQHLLLSNGHRVRNVDRLHVPLLHPLNLETAPSINEYPTYNSTVGIRSIDEI